MFDCGPRARPLPSDAELREMSTQDLLDRYKEAWTWAVRCDNLLQQDKKYLTDSIAERERVEAELNRRQ